MRRRDVTTIFMAAAGPALIARQATAQTCTSPCWPQTAAEMTAGVSPVSPQYPPYNAFRYLSSAQILDVQSGAATQDVTAALQNWLNASAAQNAVLPVGSYLISSQLNARNGTRIFGDARGAAMLVYKGANTIPGGGAMLAFTSCSAFAVWYVQFVCTQVLSTNATVQLHLQNAVYFEIANCVFGGANASGNALTGILIDQTGSGLVPPCGNGVLRNILAVVEPPNAAVAGSCGVHIKGDPAESMVNIMMSGEGAIEHFNVGVKIENAANCTLQNWEFRGSAAAGDTSVQLVNASSCTIVGTAIAPQPAIGTGISIDANSFDNVVINPGWNFSSGAPRASLVDNGARTTVIAPGATGALTPTGKLPGAYKFVKPDGATANIEINRSNTDSTGSGVVLTSGSAVLSAPAWLGIAAGNTVGGQDIERVEINGSVAERVDANGQRYLHAPNVSPGTAGLANGQLTFYIDEFGNALKVLVKYSNGVVKTATLPLS